jgi:DNA (cytosine-5)-methyltransferase 1
MKFIDLFAGIGGFRIALEKFGNQCVFSSEWDKHAQNTYLANFNETPAGDITKIHEKEIPPHDILCAGFPCQAFSISGKQQGFNDTRGTLFFDIARIVKYHQPNVLLLENVKNLATHDNGNTLKIIKQTLSNLNYHLFFNVLNSSKYGCPTSRQRIYFVAFKKQNKFKFPIPTNEPVRLIDFLESDNDISEKLVIDRNDIYLKDMEIEGCPQKPVRIGTINKGGQGERIYSPYGHAITLSAYGGGAGSKTGAYLINGKVRKLTPRECANIMGFPADFKIPVSIAQAHKQFGNSVAVPVLEAILKEIYQVI